MSVRLAPGDETGVDRSSTLIALGSPAFNVVSAVIERDYPGLARFQDGNQEIAIPDVGATRDDEAFIVERAINPNLDRCAFYVAGQSALGTETAAGYLVTHWEELHKRFPRNVSFALVFAGKFREGGTPELLFQTRS